MTNYTGKCFSKEKEPALPHMNHSDASTGRLIQRQKYSVLKSSHFYIKNCVDEQELKKLITNKKHIFTVKIALIDII